MEYSVYSEKDWQEVSDVALKAIGKAPFRVKLINGLKRSLPQNSLFHAVCNECAIKTGIKNVHWWKAYLKQQLGMKNVHIDLDGQPFIEVISTTQYSKKQMGELVEKIQAFMMTEHNVEIILPDELRSA